MTTIGIIAAPSALPGQRVEVMLAANGPRVVQVEAALGEANRRGEP